MVHEKEMREVMKGERKTYIKVEKSTQNKQINLIFLLVPLSN